MSANLLAGQRHIQGHVLGVRDVRGSWHPLQKSLYPGVKLRNEN